VLLDKRKREKMKKTLLIVDTYLRFIYSLLESREETEWSLEKKQKKNVYERYFPELDANKRTQESTSKAETRSTILCKIA
jgi:hypothetical protein